MLAKLKAEILETHDARKAPYAPADALKAARAASRIVATRGRALIEIDLRVKPPVSDADLLAVLIGPSGNLRAPAARMGATLVIGFNEAAYRAALAAKP